MYEWLREVKLYSLLYKEHEINWYIGYVFISFTNRPFITIHWFP
jgi:hypothetical protein